MLPGMQRLWNACIKSGGEYQGAYTRKRSVTMCFTLSVRLFNCQGSYFSGRSKSIVKKTQGPLQMCAVDRCTSASSRKLFLQPVTAHNTFRCYRNLT